MGKIQTRAVRALDELGIPYRVLKHAHKAQNVEEALMIFNQFNLDWGSGPPLHYLIADRAGRSILLEYWGGETMVYENQSSWQAATNFLQSAHPGDLSGNCHRYDAISERLESSKDNFTTDNALHLLAEVSQGNTQWSIVYDMSLQNIHVGLAREFDKIHTFSMPD